MPIPHISLTLGHLLNRYLKLAMLGLQSLTSGMTNFFFRFLNATTTVPRQRWKVLNFRFHYSVRHRNCQRSSAFIFERDRATFFWYILLQVRCLGICSIAHISFRAPAESLMNILRRWHSVFRTGFPRSLVRDEDHWWGFNRGWTGRLFQAIVTVRQWIFIPMWISWRWRIGFSVILVWI